MQIIYKDGKKFLSLKHKKGEHICKHFVPVGDFCKNADNFLRLMNKYEERIYEYSKTNKCRFARIDRKYSFLLSIFAMQMAYSFEEEKSYDTKMLDYFLGMNIIYFEFPQKLILNMFKNRIKQQYDNILIYLTFADYLKRFGHDYDAEIENIYEALYKRNFSKAYLILMNIEEY